MRGLSPGQAVRLFLGMITSLNKGCNKAGVADKPGCMLGHLSVISKALKHVLSFVNLAHPEVHWQTRGHQEGASALIFETSKVGSLQCDTLTLALTVDNALGFSTMAQYLFVHCRVLLPFVHMVIFTA